MDIKELTEKYRERFEAFYHTEGNNTDRKGNRRKRTEESPSFLKEVIRPILDMLPELLPKYGFTKTTDEYAMYGKYYRIKAGVVLIGGFSINEDFGLFFTPLFHGKACGKSHRIDNMNNSLKPSVRSLKKGGENERIVPLIKSGASPQFIVYLSNKKVCIYLSDEPPTTELVAGTFYVWQTPNHTHILYEKGTDYPSVLRRDERKAWHGNYYPFPCR